MIDRDTIERYLDQISRCTTLNEFNRVHIQIEIHCSPAEVCAIIDAVRERGIPLLPNLQRWHALLDEQLRGAGRRVEPYARTPISPGATLYSAEGTPDERARRTLVIAFTGVADRLMMPLATFLQHCPADAYDFLVLFDRTRSSYLRGIAGFGDDLPASLDALRARIAPAGHRRAVALGTSGGGFAAVWAGIDLGLHRAVSVGGSTPGEIENNARTPGIDTSGFGELIRRRAGRLPEVVYIAGEHATRDLGKGRSLQRYLPTTLIVVPGCDNHNTLHFLRRRGELGGLLARLFGHAPVDAAAPIAGSG